jgi:hypothetical protein
VPKILLLDIETAPAKVYCWGLWNQNIGLNQIIEPGRTLCWGAKWLGNKEIYYADERRGARRMFQKVHELLSVADAVVTYNGDKFDLPRLNGAFVEMGLGPIPPVASIDLLKTVRKLGAQSNKLAFIAPHLRIGEKMNTGGFELWTECLAGRRDAWDRMRRYNVQDVLLLGRLYNVLRPYIKNHPRLHAKVAERPSCRVCNSTHIQFRGPYFTKEIEYDRYQCQGCGTWDKRQKPSQKKVASRNNRNSNKG